MKKVFAVIFVYLTLSSSVFAEDMSHYQIDGLKIGDSLLDYLSEKQIQENFEMENGIFIQASISSKNYDLITINYLRDDKKYIMHEISGRKIYSNEDCLNVQKSIVTDISNQFGEDVKMDDKGQQPYRGDKSGESKMNVINFYFATGIMHIGCYNFSDNFTKENGIPDLLNVSVGSEEWFYWQRDKAFK